MSDPSGFPKVVRLLTEHGVFHAFSNDLITHHLMRFGARTRNELAMVLAHIREGDIVVDLGAHIGTYAIPIARKLGSEGRLLAVEGSPAAHHLLRMNVEANALTENVRTVCSIVGSEGLPKLRRVDVAANTGAGHYVLDVAAGGEAVDTLTLIRTNGFQRPDFIKMDVEGMELFVLRSLSPLLATHRPKLYIEISTDQLARSGVTIKDIEILLRSFNYRFYRNLGERNSANDLYVKSEMATLDEGGPFFDLLALPE